MIDQYGSLGLLALGDAGLRKWREARIGKEERRFEKSTYKSKKKVLLIGWDAADWKVINPLMDAGLMPSLEKLVNGGVMGNIATLDPPLSPMLWTSIATGKHADKHGILGFIEPDMKNQTFRPVSGTSRTTHALWNILNNQGYKTNVVGWWPSHPAEPVNGTMVSNFFQTIPQDRKEGNEEQLNWKIIQNSVYPKSLTKELYDLRVHPAELTEAHLLPFVPHAADVRQVHDKGLHRIAKMIAEASTIQAVSTHLMQYSDWDFMAVYFDAIDHFCHGFMKYHPPQLKGIPDRDFRLYKDVVNSAYRFHDMMLGRMMDLVDEDTTIVLVSDHGFHSDHLRPNYIPDVPAGPAMEHNPFGVVVMNGPGIKKDERVYGATLIDVAPTILHHYDLPVGQDMDGKVLSSVFAKEKEVKSIDSWDTQEGDFYRYKKSPQEQMDSSAEALQQLVDLGYIEAPDEDNEKAMKRAINEAAYNLARVYVHKGDYEKAIQKLEQLRSQNTDDIRFNIDLFNLYTKLKEHSKALDILSRVRELDHKALPNIDILEAINLLNTGKFGRALKLLQQAREKGSDSILVLSELGKTYLRIQQYAEAHELFSQVIDLDPDNSVAYHGRAVANLRMERYQEAADDALTSIGLVYHFPAAHYHLAEALYHMQLKEESFQAFTVCLTLAPNMRKAKDWLQVLAKELDRVVPEIKPTKVSTAPNVTNDEVYASDDWTEVDEKDVITVVSGLPRSGTSLMMQILDAAGMPVLSDGERKADENNPKGYYEVEAVKALFKDNSLIKEARGKAIKVVAPLLQYLPSEYHYRVVFMQRDIGEILRSQQVMLGKDPDTFNVGVAEHYQQEIRKARMWAQKEPNVNWLEARYDKVVQQEQGELDKLRAFVPALKKSSSFEQAIDKKLYRNKLQN